MYIWTDIIISEGFSSRPWLCFRQAVINDPYRIPLIFLLTSLSFFLLFVLLILSFPVNFFLQLCCFLIIQERVKENGTSKQRDGRDREINTVVPYYLWGRRAKHPSDAWSFYILNLIYHLSIHLHLSFWYIALYLPHLSMPVYRYIFGEVNL